MQMVWQRLPELDAEMKRRKYMKRCAFEPKVYERPPSASQTLVASLLKRDEPSGLSMLFAAQRRAETVFNPQPKFTYIRSPALQVACRTIPCQWPDGCVIRRPTAWAHSNWSVHGKGTSVKASDQYVASLCAVHHSELDQGSTMREPQKQLKWWCAHQRTVTLLLQLGRWPVEIAAPNIIDYPF